MEVTEGVTPPVIGSDAFLGEVLIDGDLLIAGPHLFLLGWRSGGNSFKAHVAAGERVGAMPGQMIKE